MKRSACLELMFLDEPDFLKRIGRAKAAGFDAVEFWDWSDKDVAAIAAEVARQGIGVAGFVAEADCDLVDPAQRAAFMEGLARSTDVARRLGAPFLFIQGGQPVAGMDHAAMVAGLCANLGGGSGSVGGQWREVAAGAGQRQPGVFSG